MDFQSGLNIFKFEFEYEQYIKVGWSWIKVIPLNKWDFYKNLGTGIVAFGLIFNRMEFLQVSEKKKIRSSTVQQGLFGHNAAGPGGIQPAQGCHVEGVFEKYASSRRSDPVRVCVF